MTIYPFYLFYTSVLFRVPCLRGSSVKPVPVLPVAASSFAIPARTPRFKGFRISAWKLSVYRDLGFRTCLGIVFRFSGCRAAKTVQT